jgi:hypothetical protein
MKRTISKRIKLWLIWNKRTSTGKRRVWWIQKTSRTYKRNHALMPLLEIQIHRRNYFSAAINNIPTPCWSFRLLSREREDHLRRWSLRRDHGPSLLIAVETGTTSARIVCLCFRLRGRKNGYGEHTAWEKPADESNDLLSRNGKEEMGNLGVNIFQYT